MHRLSRPRWRWLPSRERRRWPSWPSSIELAQQYDVHPNQITAWKAQAMEGVAGIFGSGNAGLEATPAVDVKVLHAKIGELTLEVDFLAGALGKAGLLSAKR
jgi:transposase-like protein